MAPFCTHSVLAVTVSLALPSTENVVLWRFFVNIVLFSSQFQALADAMTGISNSAKQGELDHFCDAVRNFANAVCGLTENSAQVRQTLRHLFIVMVFLPPLFAISILPFMKPISLSW